MRAGLHLVVVAVVLSGALGASAQIPVSTDSLSTVVADSAAADSTAIGGRLGGAASADAPAAPQASRWNALRPTTTAEFNANVTRILLSGRITAPLADLVDAGGSTEATVRRTTYRQFDREQEETGLRSSYDDSFFGDAAQLKLNVSRRTSFDENRPGTGDPIVLDFRSADASMVLEGNHPLTDGFSHHWAVRGDIEDVEQVNRNVSNDRNLAGAGLTSVWRRQGDAVDLRARYGYKRSTGTRLVRESSDDATAELDTLGARLDLDALPRTNLSVEAQRTTFFEERLDFARNANGVVDTLNTLRPVGREREVRSSYDLSTRVDTAPVERLTLAGSASTEFSETEYRFSQQGIVQRGGESFDAGATFHYAEAGSVEVRYDFSNRFNDRRVRGGADFRGRESTKNYEVGATLRQAMFARSDLELRASQSLTQSIFEETGNNNDRDRLIDDFSAEIATDAIAHTQLRVGGTARRTLELNIAADRVGNNKEEVLYEVRGSYTFDPPGGFSAAQTYRLQIVFRDFLDGIDRDSFNKQGQVTSRADYTFSGGGAVGVEWLSDFRSTGARDPASPVRELYVTESTRNDQRVVFDVSIPVSTLTFSARTERGFLDQETRGRESTEERGRLNLRLTGNRSFFSDRAQLRLDIERVLQFGPRVRDEQRDYWVANTTLTVEF
ncbi:MAG TPA: hypothetical protein VKA86_10520 [Candidatus Krumholzibacteria bacterium]|nr:hypothetical protein [Candidatus Krumholzibacteria bacterium]